MVNEVTWQTKIVKRLKKEGGYGKKWATQLTVGVPDLITAIPQVGGALIEVKLEKNWNKNTNRTIKFTPKQLQNLHDFREAGGKSLGLVVMYYSPFSAWLAPVVPPVYGESASVVVSRDELLTEAFDWYGPQLLVNWLREWFLILEPRRTSNG